jgi:hypothetical protein
MAINVRRVVTGHDEHGKTVVKRDDRGKHVKSSRPNLTQQLIWTSAAARAPAVRWTSWSTEVNFFGLAPEQSLGVVCVCVSADHCRLCAIQS